MKRLIAAMAVMIAISCCGMVAGGANNLPRGFDPVQIQTPIPKKFEDKFAMSQLVVRGTVTSISKADTGKAAAGVTESRTRMIAVVRVDEPLKGSIPQGSSIKVQFLRSANNEKPPLANMSVGEKVMLFLVKEAGETSFSLINPYTGKDKLSSEVKEVRGKNNATAAGAGGVAVHVLPAATDFVPGQEKIVTVMIVNNTAQDVALSATINPSVNIELVGPDGVKISPIETNPSPQVALNADAFILHPNHFFGVKITLENYFDMSNTGKYTVKAIITPPAFSANLGSLYSAPVTFKVLGNAKKQ